MSRLASWIVVTGLVLSLGIVNLDIWRKQQVVEHGRLVLLELRPVDPRSLLQGDYMRLAYAESVFPDARTRDALPRSGTIVLMLDSRGVGTFQRVDDGAPLGEQEIRLEYKLNPASGDLRLGAETFFFEEGQAELYADAEYGVLRVGENGSSVLVGLADEALNPITPETGALAP